jgi:hypothetical protein
MSLVVCDFRCVDPGKSNSDFDVMNFCFDGIAVADPDRVWAAGCLFLCHPAVPVAQYLASPWILLLLASLPPGYPIHDML